MAQNKTITATWGDLSVPAGSPAVTGATVSLCAADGSVVETQTLAPEGSGISFAVPAGLGWYVTGQTYAGTEAVGPPVQSAPFDVVDAPITIRIVATITVS